MAIYHHTTRMIGRSSGGNPVRALAYITGTKLSDERTGEIFDFKDKAVEEVRIILPHNAPEWARDLQKLFSQKFVSEDRDKALQLLSSIANSAEKRGDAQVYREVECSLPRELTYEQNKKLAEEYVQDQFCGLGMLAVQSFHIEKCEKTGELNPHCHTFFLTRELDKEGLALKKNRDWNQRSVHETWREQWAQYASFHLKMHGHDITLDHRSYKDQGLDIEPQVKLGKGVKEQEKRAKAKGDLGDLDHRQDPEQNLNLRSSEDSTSRVRTTQGKGFVEDLPSTDRVQELRSIQLRNLYRILRRPETVLDIVTRHHSTFMWGDVQKILGRYVDEPELFQRLDARLRNSNELLLLKMEGVRDPSGRLEERAIYTTRTLLRSENALVGTAESLAAHHTHGVSSAALERGLERIETRLQQEGGLVPGYSLSQDQVKAIRHLVDDGQLKCVVGYAGAGKTTALEACRDIWESEGYKVYGLAPTGRAAQNLEGSGISSQTLHKFLKSFEEGRCQYNSRSVLVLDEAGMVNVERFDQFLGAVKTLGVKAVVVGDGAQLQPVEAGPAFRLVTEKVGVSRLEEVVRQKQDWQREATVLFGKQKSQKAIQVYQEKGHVHLIEEPLSQGKLPEDVLTRYEVSTRTSGLIFREIMRGPYQGRVNENDHKERNRSHQADQPQRGSSAVGPRRDGSQHREVSQHWDYPQFLQWKEIQKEAAGEILGNSEAYRGALEARGLNPLEMARLFVNKKQDRASQYAQAAELLKSKKLDHLIGVERSPVHPYQGNSVEVRSAAKAALIENWKQAYHDNLSFLRDPSQEGPSQEPKTQGSLLMMAYSNKDVRDLNAQARAHLKSSGALGEEDINYTITREVEDDFGRRTKLKETRSFSTGDRIVFTRNKPDLGVKNGSMGTILSLDKNKIEVALDKDKTLSFSPHMFSFFDQGWAVTIHKSQGTTVDKSFILASHEMNQNLTYVAMTRHREDVQVYGSTMDFWAPEKVSEILSKSGEKLGAADYLDAQSLSLLMKDEDKFLDRLFTRLSDELHAMGAVSKQVFGAVADHFLGRSSKDPLEGENLILLKPEAVREEDRANEILQKTEHQQGKGNPGPQDELNQQGIKASLKINTTLQDVYEDWKHPAFKHADFYKRVFAEGLKIHGDHTRVEEEAIQYWNEKREPYMKLFEQKIEQVESELLSPLLSYMSDESRTLARKAALEDPDRALDFLAQVKVSKQADKDALEKAQQISSPHGSFKNASLNTDHSLSPSWRQEEEALQRNAPGAVSSYFKFKELHYEQQNSPYDSDLKKELRDLSKNIFKNKEMFEQIERLDPEISKLIKKAAIEKTRELERGYDRGGYSM